MERYWKTILLLLAVIIQSSVSTSSTEPPATVSQTTDNTTTSKTITVTGTLSTLPWSSSTTEEITTNSVTTDTTSEQTTVSKSVPSPSVTSNSERSSTSATVETSTSSADETTPAATTSSSTAPTPTTTSSAPPSLTTSSSTAPTLTTTSSTAPTLSTATATAAGTSVGTTPATPSLAFLISETNLLLTNDSSRYFVEIQVSKNAHSDSFWLVIQNASTDASEGLLLNQFINISSSINNISSSINNTLYLYENVTAFNKMKGLDSVLIALYAEEVSPGNLTTKGLHDILLYSSSGNICPGLTELFANISSQNLIIDYVKLNISVPVSLSRCSQDDIANSVAVLTLTSPGQANVCNLKVSNPLEMELTTKNLSCSLNSSTDFQSALRNYVISDVNEKARCGLSEYMLRDMEVTPVCVSEGKGFDVKFTVVSAFPDQDSLIMIEYINFVHQQNVTINGEYYYLSNCYKDCFNRTTPPTSTDGITPPTSTDDNKIRVTVAVVVSCIGVFLLVLLLVVLYLRRKRKGILQFHMTRLDEDDDLAGDMDDFVGHQGPTFRSYR